MKFTDAEHARWHVRWSRDRTFVVLTDRRSGYRRNFLTVAEAKAFVRGAPLNEGRLVRKEARRGDR